MAVGDNLRVLDDDDCFVGGVESCDVVVSGEEVALVAADIVDWGVVETVYVTAVDDNLFVHYLVVFDSGVVQLVDVAPNNDLGNVDEDADYVSTVVV